MLLAVLLLLLLPMRVYIHALARRASRDFGDADDDDATLMRLESSWAESAAYKL